MPKRRRLATGIYADANGIAVIYHAHGRPVETRFELGRPVDQLIRWRKQQLHSTDTVPTERRGSLTRDAVRYLKRLKGLPGCKSEKAHLRAWLFRLGGRPRWTITRVDVELAIAAWREQGYAAREIRHRCRVLEALYHRLDGSKATTPLDDVVLPQKPKSRPVTVSDDLIGAVALELRKHEILRTLRDGKTRARFLVLATTGKRPVEVMRAEREDVDLARRLWFTRTAKGGHNVEVFLNDEQLAAWHLFIAAQAWGTYDSRSFSKTVQRSGWPKGIRPYQLRHSAIRTLRHRGGDPSDVQETLGHTSIETGRTFYYGTSPAQQAAVSAMLDQRFGVSAFAPLPRTVTTNGRSRHGERRQLTSIPEDGQRADRARK